jgi:hypothetical protein
MDLSKNDLPRGYGNPGKRDLHHGKFAVDTRRVCWSYRMESERVAGTVDGNPVKARRPKRNQWKFKVRKPSGETKVMTAKKVYRNERPEDKPQPAVMVTSAEHDDRNERAYWQAGYQSKFKRLV